MKLLGYDDETHHSKCIVPPGTVVEDIVTEKVTVDDAYGCDVEKRAILFPLTKVKSMDEPDQMT